MRKIVLVLLVVTTIAVLAVVSKSYIGDPPLGGASGYVQLKPEVTTTLNTRKFTKPTTSVAAVTIKDQLFGAKVILPLTVVTTDKGDNLLVLINKKIRLPANYVPSDLVTVDGFPGAKLRAEASGKLLEMFVSAQAENLNLIVVSAYRSYTQQTSVFNSWVASAGLKNAESFSARPGHSQHQLGTAIDIGALGKTTFSDVFGKTPEGVWLVNNSAKFGFVLSYPSGKEAITGYSYEPWHFRYIGVNNADTLAKSGLILEEYLQKFGTW